MSCLVFSMSLSLMGVWELRVPSFLGGAGAQKLMQKEGAVGAVYKGVITTLLAIPCGAPLLSPALTWVERQVEAGATGTVYMAAIMMGLGMAAPYLIIGAFPELLRFMPKPGAWMETFKKAMGYFLLLAVVWILYSVPREDLLATVALMFAIWFLCWLVGRLPITASTKAKAWSWAGGLVVVGLTFMIGFQWLLNPSATKKIRAAAVARIDEGEFDDEVKQRITDGEVDDAVMGRFALLQQEDAIRLAAATGNGDPGPPTVNEEVVTPVSVAPEDEETVENEASNDEDKSELPWQPFKRDRFEKLVGESKTILIDFTADWCLTCKALEASVLNTKPIREFVDQNGVITLKADWTRGDPEITEMLEILGGKQVPVIAIFPAGNPNEPLILRGWYTKDSLLEELKKAGPSAGIAAKRRTAMRVP
jgi:thiol:disulfide interchange protein